MNKEQEQALHSTQRNKKAYPLKLGEGDYCPYKGGSCCNIGGNKHSPSDIVERGELVVVYFLPRRKGCCILSKQQEGTWYSHHSVWSER